MVNSTTRTGGTRFDFNAYGRDALPKQWIES